MPNKIVPVRTVVAIGIGAALTFVLMRFAAIPSGVPNTNLNLSAAVVAVFAGLFGPVAGLLIAFIAHTIVDITWGGIWWSWVIADGFYGFIVGFFWRVYAIEAGGFTLKKCFIFNGLQIIANLVAWGVVAPSLDILIYQEPMDKVFLQGVMAGSLNAAVVLILGSLLAFGYSKTRTKTGSLKTE